MTGTRTHRIAARLNRRRYAVLVDRPLESTGPQTAGVVTAGVPLLLTVGVPALAGLGCRLLVAYTPFRMSRSCPGWR
ncbi:hypothetical protein FJK98_24575 [Micromonospora sp. HM134]|uniref:hypothetical protein n=1 Tax=unclassified Micromonospora TaxID=2617518 RepID=UPI0011988F6B|nr:MULTISPECIES: hypothetical protein [unclassified Micromonospora]QDY09935.1 hypothetical protein FJK98_24575 [Micromonospora sp. HM134]